MDHLSAKPGTIPPRITLTWEHDMKHEYKPQPCTGTVMAMLEQTDDSDLWQELHHLRRRVEKLESHGTEPPDKDARPGGFYDVRPSGFYWVKNKKVRWIVAEWDAGSQAWDLLGYTHGPCVADEDLDTIGPRTHPPED